MTSDTTQELAYPPRVTPFTEPFWNGLDEGVLRTSRCRGCSHMTFPPKPICPECWQSDLEWVDLSGRGTLYSYTEVSAAPATFADEAPYVLCLVDLDEGVRCLSRINAQWDQLRPDQRVKVTIRDSTPVRLFDFEIDSSEEDQ
ncbi:Zn-ribbon domain-containing OB-fold protein [Rhodococcus sp. 14C212]|uniref:Zn-ribbon domain-containing OB-fold protein n=1 Tax=Rhodococcus sp. 14C212 TaxID=2711209 RepID=UPI0013EC44B1|nr:Zn-ribbon domain-containing OB-fold protein [Rhodococcus sp. 14C212]NGP07789.1 Zn-ribbon domain-containing OB-fold protein [Rhodococcus sp. 14C212]